MAINVQHSAPIALQGQAAMATGTAVGQAQAAPQANEMTRFLLGMREQRRQFDINTALRINAQDIENRQYNQQLAMQDARQTQYNANAELNRQAQLASQQMREEYDLAAQQQYQYNQYQAQGARTLDEHIFDAEAGMQQMQLNPEGQRLRNELVGRLRRTRDFTRTLRPDARNSAMEQWYSDYSATNLGAYEVKEPTAQEKVFNGLVPLQGQQMVPGQPLPPGVYRSLKGTRNGVDSWETITIPPVDTATTVERFERDRVPTPDGGFMLWNPDKQDWTHVAPTKPEKVAPEKPVDAGKYLKEAVNQLRTEHQLSQTGEVTTPFKFSMDNAKARAKELMAAEKELLEESDGDESGFTEDSILHGQPDLLNAKHPQTAEEVLSYEPGDVFFWNGQYARLENDGTVTVIE